MLPTVILLLSLTALGGGLAQVVVSIQLKQYSALGKLNPKPKWDSISGIESINASKFITQPHKFYFMIAILLSDKCKPTIQPTVHPGKPEPPSLHEQHAGDAEHPRIYAPIPRKDDCGTHIHAELPCGEYHNRYNEAQETVIFSSLGDPAA
ncbi:hypothetical protein DFH08DRAFT_813187 [Mycena albidolilacea]|uniref:Uncharacterized protein n=1 Tax=Mycena albidolilacea TaxID=1033008 RepID=A0AAD6ZSB3_9AGAR|nr:hypothetical protein DFH08DRAFT_813187 [Mycena albidolilacea]